MIEFDEELDLCGLSCPLPTLRAGKALARMEPGRVLRVIATDPSTAKDIPAFVRNSGNELLEFREDGGKYYYLLRKAEG
ncbi:MAG TPA: SirA family protein [Sedimenticola sp.]|nr:SirA family protein [Sedimenticola sp.]